MNGTIQEFEMEVDNLGSSILLPVCHSLSVFRCNTWSVFPIKMRMWTGLIYVYQKRQKKFATYLI